MGKLCRERENFSLIFFVTYRKLLTVTALTLTLFGFWGLFRTSKPAPVNTSKEIPKVTVSRGETFNNKKGMPYAQWEKYTVESGDNLYYLAKVGKTTVERLMEANDLTSDRLDVGQVLLVPRQIEAKIKPKQAEIKKQVAEDMLQPRRRLKTSKISRGYSGITGELIEWNEANRIYTGIARVIDVKTGKSFMVRRNSGHEHADSDPLTAEDTAIMKELYGGQWSWSRRAIVLEVGGRRLAASMNGMPHGRSATKGNNFPGHFCIHFLGSRTHGSEYTKSGVPKVDPAHQAMVHKAAGH